MRKQCPADTADECSCNLTEPAAARSGTAERFKPGRVPVLGEGSRHDLQSSTKKLCTQDNHLQRKKATFSNGVSLVI